MHKEGREIRHAPQGTGEREPVLRIDRALTSTTCMKLKAKLALQEARLKRSNGETEIGHAVRLVEEAQDVLAKVLDKKVCVHA